MKELRMKIRVITRFLLLFIGALLASIGLELFLIPNNIIDGGITGISIMLGYVTKLPIGGFIFVLNLPFLFVGYKHIGKTFAISMFFSVVCLSIMVVFLHPIEEFTKDLLLVTVFGGIFLGAGVGLVIRHGGCLDGTEVVAIIVDKKTGFSVGEIVLFFNIFILSLAGFVFGWDRAMYSLLAYLIAFKVVDITIEGLVESKAVMVVSDKPDVIADALMNRLGRGVTYFYGKGGYSSQEKAILYSIVSRLEVSKLKTIVNEIDNNAFIVLSDVREVMGGTVHKKPIH
ncbi:YitT family protein [Candidatus Magnetobacterium casense]|uniref:YitT family protein n=1 Tax=Candidatus Magnetobacterium casense TaxID=1455061 RepID=A0ABS6RTV6_9BACT|nr:YitT family protein [Candidatus Magnetobacterium casensis]MBV6340049.1 YitT family protein [Candidatus Magnetobacterium casensis]